MARPKKVKLVVGEMEIGIPNAADKVQVFKVEVTKPRCPRCGELKHEPNANCDAQS